MNPATDKSISETERPPITREAVCCFFWCMYSVQPDWLYMGSNEFTPIFINKEIIDNFKLLCARENWGGFGVYGGWRQVVERCGAMNARQRAELASLAAPLLFPQTFPANSVRTINPPVKIDKQVMREGRGSLREEEPEEPPTREISFKD